jgi:hypothetical protein
MHACIHPDAGVHELDMAVIAVTDAEEGEVIRLPTQQCVVGQQVREERHHQVYALQGIICCKKGPKCSEVEY